MKYLYVALFLISGHSLSQGSVPWGFYAHELINRHAVFTLPPPLIGLFKKNIDKIELDSTNPDKRRYAVEWEGPRHFIDFESYPDSMLQRMPLPDTVLQVFDSTHIQRSGILPWHLRTIRYLLTRAFKVQDIPTILRYAAEAGHYLADANVPLHTTHNYNGQLTGQHGIHGFWESRLPELFAEDYDLVTGRANYHVQMDEVVWQHILQARQAVDSVLLFEAELNEQFKTSLKYTHEKRKSQVIRTYSYDYSLAYHKLLNGMVERQMRKSIRLVGDFWYTCWVDAGMPNLKMNN